MSEQPGNHTDLPPRAYAPGGDVMEVESVTAYWRASNGEQLVTVMTGHGPLTVPTAFVMVRP